MQSHIILCVTLGNFIPQDGSCKTFIKLRRQNVGFCKVHLSNNRNTLDYKISLNTHCKRFVIWAVIVAQLVEQSLLTPEVRGSNPVFYIGH